MIRTLVHGGGRMAQGVLALLWESPDYELAGVVSRSEPVDADGNKLTGFKWD